jgi:hypothetical protein
MIERGRAAGVVPLAALIAVAGCGVGPEEPFGAFPAPGGAHVLRVAVAEANFPQAPRHVRLYLLTPGTTPDAPLVDTTLADDGVPFTAQNIAVRWISPAQALVCLRASDLPDRGLRLEIGPPARVTEVPQC